MAQTETAPTPKEINQALLIEALHDKLKVAEGDLKSLQDAMKIKNDKVLKLEAENIRLKLQRTDAELQGQVDALRIEVGKKDKEMVDLRRRVQSLQDDEASILRRANVAEEKVKVMMTTIETMQKGRDAAYAETERHDKERLDAVRTMVDAQDRAKKAEARILELTKKGVPPARVEATSKGVSVPKAKGVARAGGAPG